MREREIHRKGTCPPRRYLGSIEAVTCIPKTYSCRPPPRVCIRSSNTVFWYVERIVCSHTVAYQCTTICARSCS